MIIKSLKLWDMRNYPQKEFHFSPSKTIILGANAAGKTNLLEAVFLLSAGKSFRAERDAEMIEFGKELGRVRGKISKYANMQINKLDGEKLELEIVLTRGEVMGMKVPMKKYLVNGVSKSMADFAGRLKVVLFRPEDLELVTDSPSLRRRYLDFVLVQADREYRRSQISYEKGLRQRNKVLEAIRDHGAHRHQLLFWDQLLIRNGEYITKKREEYIGYLNKCQMSNVKCQNFSKYQLVYDKSIISRDRLDQYSEEEIAAGVTLVGPHRDDMEFRIQNSEFRKTKDTSDGKKAIRTPREWRKATWWPRHFTWQADPPAGGEAMTPPMVKETRNLSHFGSRGEQRLAVLWLKLGELAYIEEITGEKPVLLLDDIFSELDHEHRKIIFEVISNQQTIMTATDLHLIDKDRLKGLEMIELDQ